MSLMRILVTCPPMLGLIDEFKPYARKHGFELVPALVSQTLTVEELLEQVPQYDGWIIGDDPASREVFAAGQRGQLKAAVKWGIGVDNVDFAACEELDIPISNTPGMFGGEVADVAVSYVIGLARQLYFIDREIRGKQAWPKPAGMSLAGKNAGVVGLGDIGRNTARRLVACDMNVTGYDPGVEGDAGIKGIMREPWPAKIENMDFLIFTCALNGKNHHMLNEQTLALTRPGIHIINVARGGLIDEVALISALDNGHVAGAALDVFEQEPLPEDSPLREMQQCIFGSHNGSNTTEGVQRASYQAMDKLFGFLNDR